MAITLGESYLRFGRELATKAIKEFNDINLELEKTGAPADTTALLESLGGILSLLETGSLKTARTYLGYVAAEFPVYAIVFEEAVEAITDFLIGNGEEEEPEDY